MLRGQHFNHCQFAVKSAGLLAAYSVAHYRTDKLDDT